MQNYAVARGSSKGPRREGPYDEGFVCLSLNCFKKQAHTDSYHLYHPTFKSHLIIPTLNPSNPDLPTSSQHLKALPLTSGPLLLGNRILIIVHRQKPPNRHMSFPVFLLPRATRLVSTLGHSWRETNWKFRWYCKNVQRLSRCLVCRLGVCGAAAD